jgi:hypothetical protein
MDLFTQTDDEVLEAATEILRSRAIRQHDLRRAETRRLHGLYVPKEHDAEHNLGIPKKLSEEEALLWQALHRNRYIVHGERVAGGTWNGDAFCRYNIREGAICIRAASRHDLLLALWASVSDQTADSIVLTEQHLQGALVKQHIRQLHREIRKEEAGEIGACADER